MADGKDKIIAMQLELIREMTERNMRNTGMDIWGSAGKEEKTAIDENRTNSTNDKNGVSKTPDAPKKADSSASGGDAPAQTPEIPPKENIEDLRRELEGYIGLDEVKREVESLINMATVYGMRKEKGLPVADMSLHMVFTGNPGTGKTMIARFMSRVYHSLDILSKGQLVETDRSGLVAGYVGQTALKTKKICESALGGVLFIDEAYSLAGGGENDFGGEAIDTLLKFMEDNRDDLVVICAGYIGPMQRFIGANPGLESRFNRYIDFADYTADEMLAIFKLQCKKNCYTLADDAEEKLKSLLELAASAAGTFGNARGVRNVFENVLVAQANRLAGESEITKEILMQITSEDIEKSFPDAFEENSDDDSDDTEKE